MASKRLVFVALIIAVVAIAIVVALAVVLTQSSDSSNTSSLQGAIEIINNTRAGIEGKIWERSYWGGKKKKKSNVFLQKTYKL